MATNGYTYTRGYEKAPADETWSDELLAGSEVVQAICRGYDGDDLIIAAATDADVVIINKDDEIQVGFATLAGGFETIAIAGGKLYLGQSGVGIYELTIPNCQAANGDLTPGLALAYSQGGGHLPSNDITGLWGWYDTGASKAYLAVCADKTGTIINITDGWDRDMDPDFGAPTYVKGNGTDDTLHWVCDGFVNAQYDAQTVAGDDFKYSAGEVGQAADSFDDGVITSWIDVDSSGGSGTYGEAGGKLSLSIECTADGAEDQMRMARDCLFTGPYDFKVKIDMGAWPADVPGGRISGAGISLWSENGDPNPTVRLERSRIDVAGVDTDYISVDCTPTLQYSEDVFWLRIYSSDGWTAAFYYRTGDSDSWISLGAGAVMPVPVQVRLEVFSDIGAHTQSADFITFESGYQSGYAFGGAPPLINAIDVTYKTSHQTCDSLFIGTDYGAYGVSVDASTEESSEYQSVLRGLYGRVGSPYATYEALQGASDVVTAIAASSNAAVTAGGEDGDGWMHVGTSAGVSSVNLNFDQGGDGFGFWFDASRRKYMDADTTRQILLADAVTCLCPGGFCYGTAGGAGWIEPDGTAPTDYDDFRVRVMDTDSDVLLGADKPGDDDYEYSEFIRSDDDGATYDVLQTDGSWSTGADLSLETLANHPDGQMYSYRDEDVADGDYIYGVDHYDDSGNYTRLTETKYIGNPTIDSCAAVDHDTGGSTTQNRGVIVTCSGSSHDGTLNGVAQIQIREQGQTWTGKPWRNYTNGAEYNFTVSAGAGTKTIEVRGRDEGGAVGSANSCTIQLTGQSESTAAVASNPMILAYNFMGDDATITSDNTDASYSAANVVDNRLGKVWRSSDESASHVQLDLGSDQTVKYISIHNHNFGDFDDAYDMFGLGDWILKVQYAISGGPWIDIDITALAIKDQNAGRSLDICLDLEDVTARYIRIYMEYTSIVGPDYFEIGRVCVVVSEACTIQPTINFSRDYNWGVVKLGEERINPSVVYAVNPRDARLAEVNLRNFTRDAQTPFLTCYQTVGKHTPVLLILKPELLPTRTDPTWPNSADAPFAANCFMYCRFDQDELVWQRYGVNHGATSMRFLEMLP